MLDMLWKISLQAALLAAVVWLISRLTKRSPARLRHALWVIVLAKFLVPPSVQFPSQLAFWLSGHHVQPTAVAPRQVRIPVEGFGGQITPAPGSMVTSSGRTEIPREISRAPIDRVPSVAGMITMGWAIGVFLMLTRLVLIRVRQARLLSNAALGDERMERLLSDSAAALGVRRLPNLMVSPNVSTPMLAGLFRPTIYLPPRVAEACGETDARAMLLHELAHIKRMDMAVAWLYQIVNALFFFHPALWLAGRELAVEREFACDELVVVASAMSPADYAAGYVTALRFANGVAGPRLSLGMAEPFSIGKRRLELMLQESRPRMTRCWAAALLVIALIGLPTFAGVRAAGMRRYVPVTRKITLRSLVVGTHNAVSAVQSGRGKVTKTQWHITAAGNPNGPVFEYQDIYSLASAGDKCRVSIDTTLLKNTVKMSGAYPNKPGYKGRRELLIDGRTITNFVGSIYSMNGNVLPSPRATIGEGTAMPMETGGFIRGRRPHSPVAEIELSGQMLPGNGLIDLTQVSLSGPPKRGKNILRLAGHRMLHGDKCYIVEMIAPYKDKRQDNTTFRMWIIPSKGYIMPRVQVYSVLGSKRSLWQEVTTSVKDYGNGMWGPAKVIQNFYSVDRRGRSYKDQVITITYDRDFQLNLPISPDELKLELPSGTRVYDESSGQYHTIGSPKDQPGAKPEASVSPKPANEPKAEETAESPSLPCKSGAGTWFGYRTHPITGGHKVYKLHTPAASLSPKPTKPAHEQKPKETAESSPLPCVGNIGTPFGYRIHPITHVYKLHTGVDIIAPQGTPIRAVADGNVITADWKGAYGNTVVIDQGPGVSMLYAHCSKLVVSPGQNVHQGDVIAYVGSTGYSAGPHLHFEKRQGGAPVNPL